MTRAQSEKHPHRRHLSGDRDSDLSDSLGASGAIAIDPPIPHQISQPSCEADEAAMPSPSSSNVSSFSTLRARSYIFRLPLFTRCAVSAIGLVWVISVLTQSFWDLKSWWSLAPKELSLTKRQFCGLYFSCRVARVLRVSWSPSRAASRPARGSGVTDRTERGAESWDCKDVR